MTHDDDTSGFLAEQPEHCHDCYRLIRPGQTYHLTIDNAILCPKCIRGADAIRLNGCLAVEVGENRLLMRRGDDVAEVFPGKVRHLVNALVEGAATLITGCTENEGSASGQAGGFWFVLSPR